MLRPSRLLLLLAVASAAVAALAVPGTASARTSPPGAPFRVIVVDKMSDAAFATLARRGAVGLMRPGFGPRTSHRSAFAELVRGAEVNSHIGGTPPGNPLIGTEHQRSAWIATWCRMCIVLQLPPGVSTIPNDKLYRVGIVGRGYHGLLTSPTTHIQGLLSIVDLAPTALGRPSTGLSAALARSGSRSRRTTTSSTSPCSSPRRSCSSSRSSAGVLR